MAKHGSEKPDLDARSPWSGGLRSREVRLGIPGAPVDTTITVSGSKSMTNRSLIIAALAEGESRLEGLLRSDDSYWCIEALKKVGADIQVEGETARVKGTGGRWRAVSEELYTGASGTLTRFLPAALAAGHGTWQLNGSRRITERPIQTLLDTLVQQGAGIQYRQTAGRLPITLQGNGLLGGEATISGGVSSQFVSGLLLAAPYALTPLTVCIEDTIVQRDYVQMTLEMMEAFGVRSSVSEADMHRIHVAKGVYQGRTFRLEPDVSTCGYFWAMAAITGGRVRITGINPQTTRQPDIELLDVLERMGCVVVRGDDFAEVQGTSRLRGGFTLSMERWSDQTLTMAVLAVYADAPITLTDAAHIRQHECDRIAAICSELRKLGIDVTEHADGLTVRPGNPTPALLDPHDDHRMAMALSLVAAKTDGIRIADPGCVSKTCPDYFERMERCGFKVETN